MVNCKFKKIWIVSLRKKKIQFLNFFKRMSGIQLPGQLVLKQITTWEIADTQKQLLITECHKPRVSLPSLVFTAVLEGRSWLPTTCGTLVSAYSVLSQLESHCVGWR